jgi:hypothetical protein
MHGPFALVIESVSRLAARSVWIGVIVLFAACNDPEVPDPPDLTELRAGYTAPTGTLTVEALQEAAAQFLESDNPMNAYNEFQILPALIESLDEITEQGQAIDLGRIELDGEALGTITMRCEEDAGTTGSGSLRFVTTEKGLDPSLWGTLTDCGWEEGVSPSGETVTNVYDGEFNIWLVDQAGFAPNSDAWLAQFDGTIGTAGNQAERVHIDMRWKDKTVTRRLPLTDGSWFFITHTIGASNFSFEDIRGTVGCNIGTRVCTSEDHPIGTIAF